MLIAKENLVKYPADGLSRPKGGIRSGQYRRVLIPPEKLKEEASTILHRLHPLISLWRDGVLADAEMAGLYILIYLQHRRPNTWSQGPHSVEIISSPQNLTSKKRFCLYDLPIESLSFNDKFQRRMPSRPTIYDLFGLFSLRSVPLAVNKAIIKWMEGRWNLNLMTRVPSAREVLNQQCQGNRCVTMVIRKKELECFVLGERDPLGFILHDLIHADRFYHDPMSFKGQVGLCRFLAKAMENDFFSALIQRDAIFASDLEYAISDMNSYCVHSLMYLKAICLGHFLRKNGQDAKEKLCEKDYLIFENFIRELLQLCNVKGEVEEAVLRLNTPKSSPESDFPLIQSYFDGKGIL